MTTEEEMTVEQIGEQRAKEFGLKTHPDPEPSYYADDIHKLLGESYDVYAQTHFGKPKYWGPLEPSQYEDTHKGYVLGVRQIDQSSREEEMVELLKKFVDLSVICKTEDSSEFQDLFDRAKSLLERKP